MEQPEQQQQQPIDTAESLIYEKQKLLQEEMENAVNLSVKLTVNVGKGKNWFEAK